MEPEKVPLAKPVSKNQRELHDGGDEDYFIDRDSLFAYQPVIERRRTVQHAKRRSGGNEASEDEDE